MSFNGYFATWHIKCENHYLKEEKYNE
jgi:hypothetical protein